MNVVVVVVGAASRRSSGDRMEIFVDIIIVVLAFRLDLSLLRVFLIFVLREIYDKFDVFDFNFKTNSVERLYNEAATAL